MSEPNPQNSIAWLRRQWELHGMLEALDAARCIEALLRRERDLAARVHDLESNNPEGT